MTPLPDRQSDWQHEAHDEGARLVLEAHRLCGLLGRAGLLSRASSARLARSVSEAYSRDLARRHAFTRLVLDITLALGDGTLREGRDFTRENQSIHLHVGSAARALYHGGHGARTDRELHALLQFGRRRFPDVVLACSARAQIAHTRRRVVVLDIGRMREGASQH